MVGSECGFTQELVDKIAIGRHGEESLRFPLRELPCGEGQIIQSIDILGIRRQRFSQIYKGL